MYGQFHIVHSDTPDINMTVKYPESIGPASTLYLLDPQTHCNIICATML